MKDNSLQPSSLSNRSSFILFLSWELLDEVQSGMVTGVPFVHVWICNYIACGPLLCTCGPLRLYGKGGFRFLAFLWVWPASWSPLPTPISSHTERRCWLWLGSLFWGQQTREWPVTTCAIMQEDHQGEKRHPMTVLPEQQEAVLFIGGCTETPSYHRTSNHNSQIPT